MLSAVSCRVYLVKHLVWSPLPISVGVELNDADVSYEKCFGSEITSESEQLDPGVRSSTVGNLKCTHARTRPEAARFTRKAACPISVTSDPSVPLRYGSTWARGRRGNWQLHKFATQHTALGPCCICFWTFETTPESWMPAAERVQKCSFGGPIDCIIFREVSRRQIGHHRKPPPTQAGGT